MFTVSPPLLFLSSAHTQIAMKSMWIKKKPPHVFRSGKDISQLSKLTAVRIWRSFKRSYAYINSRMDLDLVCVPPAP